jgi:hypothetical protein
MLSVLSLARAVGHPVQPLPDVRCPDARSAKARSPKTVTQGLHVSLYSGEPFTSSLAINLFTNRDCRTALGDEPSELRPQVSSVGCSEPLACD